MSSKFSQEHPWHPRVLALVNSRSIALMANVIHATILCWFARDVFRNDGTATVGDDNSSHFVECSVFANLVRAGKRDFWFESIQAGYPLFDTYTPLPVLFTGGIMVFTNDDDVSTRLWIFRVVLGTLWIMTPFCWYKGARWMGMQRLPSFMVSLFYHCIKDQANFGLGGNAMFEKGLFAQTWASPFVPLVLSAWIRVASRDIGLITPMLLFSGILMSNAFSALFTGISCVWVCLTQCATESLYKALGTAVRLVLIGCVSITLNAFWLLPFVIHMKFQGGFPFKDWDNYRGHEITKATKDIISGEMLDSHSYPFVTMLTVVGLFRLCVGGGTLARLPSLARGFIVTSGFWSVAMLLGPRNLGRIYLWMPFHSNVEAMRYITGIHFVGLMSAAVGTATLLDGAVSFMRGTTFDHGGSNDSVVSPSDPYLPAPLLSVCRRVNVFTGIARSLLNSNRGAIIVSLSIVALGLYGCIAMTSHRVSRFHYPKTVNLTRNAQYVDFERALQNVDTSRGRVLYTPKTGHFVNHLLPHTLKFSTLTSYARGYHDTLSFYYNERLDPEKSMSFRLFNIQHVIHSPRKTDAGWIPPSDAFAPPMDIGDGKAKMYSALRSSEWDWFDIVRVPSCVGGGLRDIRELVRDYAIHLYARGMLPRLDDGECPPLVDAKDQNLLVRGQLMNKTHVKFSFQGPDLIGSTEIGDFKVFHTAPVHAASLEAQPLRCSITGGNFDQRDPNRYSARVDCPTARGCPSGFGKEWLLLKVSFHPGWSVMATPLNKVDMNGPLLHLETIANDVEQRAKVTVLSPIHVGPNFMAVPLPCGPSKLTFVYRSPAYQVPLFVFTCFSMSVMCLVASASAFSSRRMRLETTQDDGIEDVNRSKAKTL